MRVLEGCVPASERELVSAANFRGHVRTESASGWTWAGAQHSDAASICAGGDLGDLLERCSRYMAASSKEQRQMTGSVARTQH